MFEVITASAGNSWMFENRIPHVLAGDYRPASAVDIFAKDLGIVADMGRVEKFPTPMAANALQLFLMTSAAGMGRDDDASVARLIAQMTGLDLPGMSQARDPAAAPHRGGTRGNDDLRDSPASAVIQPADGLGSRWTALLQVRELNVLTALLVVVALISFSTPYFLTTDNLMGVFRSFSLIAIMSIGMVMVIITGGIDLSVGSVHGPVVAGDGARLPVRPADHRVHLRAGWLTGLLFGLFNGAADHRGPAAAVHRHAGLAQHRARPDVHHHPWRAADARYARHLRADRAGLCRPGAGPGRDHARDDDHLLDR